MRTFGLSLHRQRGASGDHRRRSGRAPKCGRAITGSHLGRNRAAWSADVRLDSVETNARSARGAPGHTADQWNKNIRRHRDVHRCPGRKLFLDFVRVGLRDHERLGKRVPAPKCERYRISRSHQSDQHTDGPGLGRPVHLETHVAIAPVNQCNLAGRIRQIGILRALGRFGGASASDENDIAREPVDDRRPANVLGVGILTGNRTRGVDHQGKPFRARHLRLRHTDRLRRNAR